MGNTGAGGCCGCADTLDEVKVGGVEQYESRPISMGNYRKMKTYPKIVVQDTEEENDKYELKNFGDKADELIRKNDQS